MRLSFALLLMIAGAGGSLCACRHGLPPLTRPLFPMTPAWTTPVSDTVDAPIAADATNVYVATRDGIVRALERRTGAVRWQVDGRPGAVAAGESLVVVKDPGGVVWGMAPRTGATRWTSETGVAGALPPVIYKDAVVAAGQGLALLDAATGARRWAQADVRAVTVPLPSGAWLLVGEADGALRARDLATGSVVWSYATPRPLAAPPVVDDRGRVLLGTTDRRFVALDEDGKGDEDWEWRVGADVPAPPVVLGRRVLFVTHEGVLYALDRGSGNLAWRAALPSRPLSGPLLHGEGVLVACFGARPGETFLIGFDARTGARQGDLKAPGEVRGAPLITGDFVVMALRERAVAALRLGDAEANP